MNITTFITRFREAFGETTPLPLVFWYSDQPITLAQKINGCLFKCLPEIQNGQTVSLSTENIGCGGGKFYCGFTEMPVFVPNFVSTKEHYKDTPESVLDFINELDVPRCSAPFLNLARIDCVESLEDKEALLFLATPDVLSGLISWSFFDNNSSGAVVTRFGSGCSATITNAVNENRRGGRSTFLGFLPNIRGGASVPLSQSETAMKKANPMYTQYGLYDQLTQYFGDQPMTSGPVYVGAFVMALFILGCFIVKGPMKWALLGATIFSILLSWGKNFMPLTDFFIDYVPMYNKFRAVSSILVIAEFTIPLLAIFALKTIIDNPDVLKKNRGGYIASFVITAGTALVLALAPGLLVPSFVPAQEYAALQQGLPA